MKTLNVAMIGYGFMGKAHSNAWRQVARFFDLKAAPRMKLLCGRTRDAARVAAARYGWEEICTDWREAVARPDVDLVDITTMNDTHAEIAIAAAKAGKAVLCEKPLAMSVAECERMVAAVKKARVTNMVCHNYRRIPAIAQAKKMIAAGDLGEIRHYRARYLQDWIADPNFPMVWRLQGKLAGSGTHGDIHAHIIDLARNLVGEFAEVTGLLHTFVKERPVASGRSEGLRARAKGGTMGRVTVDDAAMCLARFRNGALGNLEATRFALGRKNGIQIEINGSTGSLVFDFEDMNRLKFYRGDDPADRRGFRDILITEGVHPFVGAWWPPGHIIGYEHTFVHAIADFVNAAALGKPTTPDFVDGLRNQQVLDAVTRSASSGRWIKLSR
ncbi:MAG: Gfo/Idh/MocA family oxidoreductase [Verrucomicrobiae bacterium]|nr:Gfo/Idh/MocA family oxidoreductase [Verrucomicrobiae bacterium]